MIKKIKAKLIEGFHIESNPFLVRRLAMTAALLFIVLFAFTTFIFINLSLGNPLLAIADMFIMLLSLFSLYLLFVKKKIEFAAMVSTGMLFSFLIFFSFITKNNGFGLVWTLCFSLFVIPILGTRKGLLVTGIFYLILVPMVYAGIGEWDNGFWDKSAFVRFFMASLTFVYMAYFFESSSVSAYTTILEIREKEKIYLNKLENLSVTDQLTGLHNRRYFDDHFEVERQKVKRYGNMLCLIMIDIDHFKMINDHYGHPTGDSVLKEFSLLLRKNIRSSDILSRWGGEEFIILLPATSIANSVQLAEKIRISIANHHFVEIGNLTASFGVSEVNTSSASNRVAIHHADEALYQAKREGRNKVVTYQ
jgi:diguanylate cyclase (GGDEF)-like protein